MTTTIAVTNQKGGVGKTTTAYNLARAAVTAGYSTLVVDADPQGNLTSALSPEPLGDDAVGLADALDRSTEETRATGLGDVLAPTLWEGLDLAPTTGETLGEVRNRLTIDIAGGREYRLREGLEELAANGRTYDVVLIDCAPSLDLLAVNALAAADKTLVVTHPGWFSSNGLALLLSTISNVTRYYNQELTIGGVLINAFDKRTKAAEHWRLEIESALTERQLPILHPHIPMRATINTAIEAGRGLDELHDTEASRLHETYSGHLATLLNQN